MSRADGVIGLQKMAHLPAHYPLEPANLPATRARAPVDNHPVLSRRIDSNSVVIQFAIVAQRRIDSGYKAITDMFKMRVVRSQVGTQGPVRSDI